MRLLIAILLIFIVNLLLRLFSTDAVSGLAASEYVVLRSSITSSTFAANPPTKLILVDREVVAQEDRIRNGRIAFTVIASCCLLLTAILLGMFEFTRIRRTLLPTKVP